MIIYSEHNKKSGVYFIKSKRDSRCYIGSAINLFSRMCVHMSFLRNNKHHSKHLQRFYNKYGKDNLEFGVYELCDKEKLRDREQYYLDTHNKEFNNSPTATSNYGLKLSPLSKEHKQKLSIALKGRNLSKETRDRMSKASKGRVCSEETKIKISNKSKRKPIIKYDKNMKEIKKYPSLTEAARDNSLTLWNVSKCLIGNTKTAGGFIWKYQEEAFRVMEEGL